MEYYLLLGLVSTKLRDLQVGQVKEVFRRFVFTRSGIA
jgi:hypothetical protein